MKRFFLSALILVFSVVGGLPVGPVGLSEPPGLPGLSGRPSLASLVDASRAQAAQAGQSFKLGAEFISYSIPEGYLPMDESLYAAVITRQKNALPREMLVHAIYVEKSADERFRRGEERIPDDYLLVLSYVPFAESEITTRDFTGLVGFIRHNQGLLSDEKIQAYERDMARGRTGQGDGTDIRPLGAYGLTETSVSYLAVVNPAGENAQAAGFEQLLVSTGLLVQGKVLVINQYHRLRTLGDVQAFRTLSDQVLAGMKFQRGGAPEPILAADSDGVANSLPQGSRRGEASLLTSPAVIAVVLILLAVFVLYRRRKSYVARIRDSNERNGQAEQNERIDQVDETGQSQQPGEPGRPGQPGKTGHPEQPTEDGRDRRKVE